MIILNQRPLLSAVVSVWDFNDNGIFSPVFISRALDRTELPDNVQELRDAALRFKEAVLNPAVTGKKRDKPKEKALTPAESTPAVFNPVVVVCASVDSTWPLWGKNGVTPVRVAPGVGIVMGLIPAVKKRKDGRPPSAELFLSRIKITDLVSLFGCASSDAYGVLSPAAPVKNLFSPQVVALSKEYAKAYVQMHEGPAEGRIDPAVYRAVIQREADPFTFRRPPVLEQEGFRAFRSTPESYTPGRIRHVSGMGPKYPDVYSEEPRFGYRDIFDFAYGLARILKAQFSAPRRGSRFAGVTRAQLEEAGVDTSSREQLLEARNTLLASRRTTGVSAPATSEFEEALARKLAKLNPISLEDVPAAIKYSERVENKENKENSEVPDIRFGRESARFTKEDVRTLFPKDWSGRNTFSAETRIPTLTSSTIVTRVASDDKKYESLRDLIDTDPNAVYDSKVIAAVAEETGMSLRETARILAVQRDRERQIRTPSGKKSKVSIPASSAAAKIHRSRKLPNYRLPVGVENVVRDQSLVLLSPFGEQGRVLSFRRGAHLDADMVADRPELLAVQLGRAIQAFFLWYAERAKANLSFKLYLGRVGSGTLKLIFDSAQDDPSVSTVSKNMASSDRDIVWTTHVVDVNTDINAYKKSAESIGKVRKPVQQTSTRVSEPVLTPSPVKKRQKKIQQSEPQEAVETPKEKTETEDKPFMSFMSEGGWGADDESLG